MIRVLRKATSPAEAGLQATDLELRALMWAILSFQQYLRDITCTMITGHGSLNWLTEMRSVFGVRPPRPRATANARSLSLSEFPPLIGALDIQGQVLALAAPARNCSRRRRMTSGVAR